MPHATWERTRQVNLDGSFYVVQAVANQMKTQIPQGGSIIGISSISALVGGEFQCHYAPTKAAILSLMQSCAVALGKYNIRANAILPGTIATDINKEDLADVVKRENMIKGPRWADLERRMTLQDLWSSWRVTWRSM
ncbi:L-rhamnose 1-dehydrogenase (NADP(+)) [Grifola frondosa]|uniref:L-rhamnose 1-dehydrogenase (NADP(+)) n=1 Tax=Grifola frondosa TaxID=5627 RepID=A0A1C7MP89_GRIFR|nr:L-rhamnose 1-dehydrogenase (NADP(+)) [Grifola frondosa]